MNDFLSGYKTYDLDREGYGNAGNWKGAFYQRISPDEATRILNEEDPHRILGTKRNATLFDIKKAYKRMAMLWHPDKNPDQLNKALAMMKKINAAYSLLT